MNQKPTTSELISMTLKVISIANTTLEIVQKLYQMLG